MFLCGSTSMVRWNMSENIAALLASLLLMIAPIGPNQDGFNATDFDACAYIDSVDAMICELESARRRHGRAVKEEKAALRRAINERISALDEEYLRESDRGIWENVLSLPEFGSAGTVFAYLSVDRECDTRRIVDQLLQEGRRVALPRSRKGGVMDFALYDGTLAEGMYGIPQPPDESETVEPGEGDLMLVPALCCDVRGVRLGHGGGYYDRYLAGRRVPAACLCRERLLLEKVPQDWNDFAVGFVITELRKIKTGL